VQKQSPALWLALLPVWISGRLIHRTNALYSAMSSMFRKNATVLFISMTHVYNCMYEPVYPRHPHHFLFHCSVLLFRVSFSRLTPRCCFDAVLITAYANCFSTSLRRPRIQTCWSMSRRRSGSISRGTSFRLLQIVPTCDRRRPMSSFAR